MDRTTSYQLTRGGRLFYLFWSLFFCISGLFLLSALFTEQAKLQIHGWPVYFFVGVVVLLWIIFATYCALRAFAAPARITVSPHGFIYQGFLRTYSYAWADITNLRWVYDRGGFEWLEVTSKSSSIFSRRRKLDFTGLQPNRIDFINEARQFAPWATTKWGWFHTAH